MTAFSGVGALFAAPREPGARVFKGPCLIGRRLKIGAFALDKTETDKEGTMAAAGRHVASMLDLVHAFEGELNVTAGAALLCWSHRCMTDAGSDWAEFFKRMQDLGLETEVGLGVACYTYHQRGQAEVAAGFAELLEALPKTDDGRAALVAYCYVSGDWKRGLPVRRLMM